MHLLPLLLIGCVGPDGAGGETSADSGPDSGSDSGSDSGPDSGPDSGSDSGSQGDSAGDSGAASTWTPLPEGCDAGADTVPDPLTRIGRYDTHAAGLFVELIDVDVRDGLAWTVGQGGVTVIDVHDPTAPTLVVAQNNDRYHKIEPLDATHAAVTHRERGVAIVDIGGGRVALGPQAAGVGWEGLLARDGYLYVTSREDGLVVFDVSDPARLVELGRVAGLTAPWEISAAVGDRAWVADAVEGVVPVDLSDPEAPTLGTPVALPGASHVLPHDGYLYVSAGGEGLVVLDAGDPSLPVEVARIDTGGSAIVAARSGDVLWVAAHESIAAFDVSVPGLPLPLGHAPADQYALAVGADDATAYVGDWTLLDAWRGDPAVHAPSLDLDAEVARLPPDGGAAELPLTNRGGAPLHLLGATTSDPRVTVEATALEIAAGEEGALRLTFAADGAQLDAELCLATDDPAAPTVRLAIEAGDPDSPVGRAAPDFTLVDLDGVSHTLSEQRGHPVFFTYFATW